MGELPNKMLAVVQREVGGKLFIEEVDIPKPGKGQVLVKMEFSSINPSDLSLLQGTFAHVPEFPLIPGIEGSGAVVASGGGAIAAMRKGKRVSCTSINKHGGTWAEYLVTSAMNVIPIDKNISFEEGSSLIVNPLTAVAFVDIAKKYSKKTIVNNAAGGALGKMLHKYAFANDVNVISIVRSKSQYDALKTIGANMVLDSSWPNYKEELKKIIEKTQAKLYFDAIGGDSTAEFVDLSPADSQIYLYANLSEQEIHFDARTLLQNNKEVKGFFLGNHSSKQSLLKKLGNIKKTHKLLKSDLQTTVSKIVDMKNINEALKEYSSNMSAGKLLLKLNNIS